MQSKKIGGIFLFLFVVQVSYAQININVADVSTFSTASQGDIYEDENGVLYIGLQSGGLSLLSDFKPRDISNELIFEDTNFYYVSMQVGTNDYLVIRMDKSDVNTEARATGTGLQPADLASVQALTYL